MALFLTAEGDYWKNITLGGCVFVTGFGAYQYYVHEQHHLHGPKFDPELNNFPYMKNRAKEFPWSCPDCSLFDQKW